jgi:hypothetical protein
MYGGYELFEIISHDVDVRLTADWEVSSVMKFTNSRIHGHFLAWSGNCACGVEYDGGSVVSVDILTWSGIKYGDFTKSSTTHNKSFEKIKTFNYLGFPLTNESYITGEIKHKTYKQETRFITIQSKYFFYFLTYCKTFKCMILKNSEYLIKNAMQ